MTGPASFRYPGDDPAALGMAALRIDETGTRVDRILQAVSLSRSALMDAWTMQATELADADLGTLVSGLPTVRAALGTAHDAVVAHQSTLSRIRGEIDDLETRFRQQSHVWESADHDYRQLAQASGTAPSLPLAAALATANAATAAQEGIWADYLRLLGEADLSAQTCADALTTAWDPQHRARNFLVIAPGAALMEHAGISSSTLNMLRIDAEVAEAGRLAADINVMQYLVGNDAGVQAKISRLAEIWQLESTNGVFATAFYTRLGPDAAVNLMARLAAVVPTNGSLDTGPLNQQLLHRLQTSMAQGFGVATQGIEYGADGLLTDTTPGGLGADYLNGLMSKGRSTISVPSDGQLVDVKGYLPLMATLANGGGYSAGTLRALGDDLLAVEAAYQADTGLAGDRVWFTNTPARPRWNWSERGSDFPMGNDPFTSWTSAILASPGASTTVLATDSNLFGYLLTDRSWTVADSGTTDPTQWLYRMTDDQDPLQGLARFGDALPTIIGHRADSADAATAFDSAVQLLGSNNTNPRMDAGDFASTDWIAPELRPGLGNLLVANVDAVHDALAGSHDTYPYSVLVADVAKDSAVGTDGMSFADRLTVAEAQLISTRPAVGPLADQQLDGQARLMATLSHGHTAADIGLQQRVDDEHNALVDSTTWAGHLAVSPVGEIPVLGATAQYLADSLIDRVGGDNQQDNGLTARNDAAELSASNHDLYVSTVENQSYAAALQTGWRPTDPALTLTDGTGQLRLFDQFTRDEQTAIEREWPTEFGKVPSNLGSDQGDVFSTHQNVLDEYLATKSGG